MNKKNVFIALGIIVGAVALFMGIISIEMNGDKIVKNASINKVDIGGLTKEEAIKKLEKEYKLGDLEIVYKNNDWKVKPNQLKLSYNIKETVNNAYEINRKGDFFKNFNKTVKSKFSEKNDLDMIISYDDKKLKEEIEKIAKEIDVEVEDAKINISGSNIEVTKEKSGVKVNIEKNIKSITENIKKGQLKTELAVQTVEPKIKEEELKEVDTLLGSYSTKISAGGEGRYTNIKLATERTSNILVMPGETYSYNQHTGVRSAANGYKNAPVIVQGVVQEGIGGGVCQVSTTLYNATLYAGLEYVNLKNHSIPSSYAPMGRDATVTNGGWDLEFKNNLQYPIYVKNYVSGSTVVCQIFGSAKDKQKIDIVTTTDNIAIAPTKKVDDPSILKGTEKVLEKGRNGYTVSTYRIYKDSNGKEIKKEKVYTSYYPKKQQVIATGTMEPVVVPDTPPVEQPVTPEQPPVQPPVDQPSTEQPPVEQEPVVDQPAQ